MSGVSVSAAGTRVVRRAAQPPLPPFASVPPAPQAPAIAGASIGSCWPGSLPMRGSVRDVRQVRGGCPAFTHTLTLIRRDRPLTWGDTPRPPA